MSRARPELDVVGIETAPIPFALAWLRARLSGCANIRVLYGDIWAHDLAPYDLAYAFLSPAPMPRLLAKARAEMRPGSRLVSNSFDVPDNIPGHAPDETLTLDDRRATRLFTWRM